MFLACILLGVPWPSWICSWISSINRGKFCQCGFRCLSHSCFPLSFPSGGPQCVQIASFIVVPLRCSPLPAPVFFTLEVSVDVRLSSEVLSSVMFSLLLLSPLKAFFISVTCFQSAIFGFLNFHLSAYITCLFLACHLLFPLEPLA